MNRQNLSNSKDQKHSSLLISQCLYLITDEDQPGCIRHACAELLETFLTNAKSIKAQVLQVGQSEVDLCVIGLLKSL